VWMWFSRRRFDYKLCVSRKNTSAMSYAVEFPAKLLALLAARGH
jgi:saccharopine dehydrogenase-like NADP-dependent oxidoreductase